MPDWGEMRHAEQKHDPPELSLEQEQRLLDAMRQDLRDFFEFLAVSGRRVSEAPKLTWPPSPPSAPKILPRSEIVDAINRMITMTLERLSLSMSTKCSTTELYAHDGGRRASDSFRRKT